jgi:hypothetical protein
MGIFWASIEPGDPAVPMPKLNVVTVDELSCGFDCRIVVGAIEVDCPQEVAVAANDVNSIIGHLRPLQPQNVPNLRDHKNRKTSVRRLPPVRAALLG